MPRTAADAKFEIWLEGDNVTGKFSIKGGRVLTEDEWGAVTTVVQSLIWEHDQHAC